ncbi:MAG: magnesium-dependent phosphatase-1 [Armatimonadota bacterium]|nr:magnesium-dependent phosphatase-1 [Armatimonadota bacterium]MDR7401254.1 magnesium-dependent phosphatase-1 [Armatimonadota bacterium]MDR7402988.1 magnesium-dependent phosphatase-1 [Armatimonadota bacterium]MDR7437148.1 magnesium-dependent phosphatase-1 [Armatimonadota bacterium]MDR7471900.1 magnesium-dependent phosphatase-1 [Armatimonadota bacterium]
MPVRLVIFDCDRTLWDHPNVTALRLPVRRVDDLTVEDADGVRVRLRPGAREVLEGLRARGILVSVASWNRPEPVQAIFEALELSHYFTRPKVEHHPYKEQTIGRLLDELAADGLALRPEEVLFVDDRMMHLDRVRRALGPVRTALAGVEVTDLRDVLGYLD